MAIPLLIILSALLLWTMLPDPDLEAEAAKERQG